MRIRTLWTWIWLRPFLTRRADKDLLDASADRDLVDALADENLPDTGADKVLIDAVAGKDQADMDVDKDLVDAGADKGLVNADADRDLRVRILLCLSSQDCSHEIFTKLTRVQHSVCYDFCNNAQTDSGHPSDTSSAT